MVLALMVGNTLFAAGYKMSQHLCNSLAEQGIKLKFDAKAKLPGYFELDCPKPYCQKAREGADPTPLRVDIAPPYYAEWKCRHCLWAGHIGDKPDASPAPAPLGEKDAIRSAKAPVDLPPEALDFLRGFGIGEETAQKRKLSWDSDRAAVKIPYFDGAEIINATLISLPTGTSRLASSKRVRFYGLDQATGGEEIIIAHRELDAIALGQLGFANVIALPNGGDIQTRGDEYEPEGDRFEFLASAAELIQKATKVKFCLDDTPEGLTIRQELARRIGPGKCAVTKYSRGTLRKTIEEMGGDDVCADLNEAKPLPIFGLYELDDFEKELFAYFDSGMAAGVGTGWPNVDKLYTVMPGQLTVVTGIPNSGKSEWVDALTLNLALNHGWKFAAFSPENGKEAHATKLIEKRVEMSADPKSNERMSFDTFYNGSLWVRKHYSFIESTDEMPTLDWILERAADAALRNGIKGLIIDPWNRIEKKMEGFRAETDYVAAALPRILRFLINYGVHGWLVVHPKQQEKDRKTGKIPAPSLYDMAGSAHFVNMADNGIVIHRSDSIDDTTEVHVKKVRFKHIGRKGDTKLSYNLITGRYCPLDQAPAKYTFSDEQATDGIKTYEVE